MTGVERWVQQTMYFVRTIRRKRETIPPSSSVDFNVDAFPFHLPNYTSACVLRRGALILALYSLSRLSTMELLRNKRHMRIHTPGSLNANRTKGKIDISPIAGTEHRKMILHENGPKPSIRARLVRKVSPKGETSFRILVPLNDLVLSSAREHWSENFYTKFFQSYRS